MPSLPNWGGRFERLLYYTLASNRVGITPFFPMQERPDIDIEKLAALARIHLSDEEKAAFAGQVSDILGFFQKLQEVDVEGIEPMSHPFDVAGPLREDVPVTPWEPARALKNAPAARHDQVVVPKVVEDA